MSIRASEERRGKTAASEPRLLLADDDAWCRALADGALRGQGYRVVCTGDVETAARIARELLPDLVVVDVSLPLIENVPASQRRSADRPPRERFPQVAPAYAVLRALELEPSGVSHPVVLLKDELPGKKARVTRFAVLGYVPKPFTPFTLVQQLDAHVGRLRLRAEAKNARVSSAANPGHSSGTALEGSVDLIGMPAVLEFFHFNRLSGVCSVRTTSGRFAEVHFREGEIVRARTDDGFEGAQAIFRLISWSDARFAFLNQAPEAGSHIAQRFEQLMLEGMRRMDEERLFPFPMLLGEST
jgi:CheY-like chemotaxis protein